MNSNITTVAFYGIDAVEIDVQVQILNGLPAFSIVGLPNKSVAESKERIRSCLFSIGLNIPPKKIVVNLSPADVQKEGSHYDLPIALALLASMGIIKQADIREYIAIGELSLDGTIRKVSGVLPASICAKANGKGVICPKASSNEAVWGGHNSIVAAEDVLELINHINGKQIIQQIEVCDKAIDYYNDACMSEIKGQILAKRAMEISAAGGHNLLISGPPGVGKSLIASRMNGILPMLSAEESLEVTMIYSVINELPEAGLITKRPYRSPHHSASLPALIGGGVKALPGEISLAHRGVLFLDELPEFSRQALEALRQPLETGNVKIARANHHVTYPSKVQLIAAMNPCKCGFLGVQHKECRNAPACGKEYTQKISGPLLDRFDLLINVENVNITDFMKSKERIETSEQIRERVIKCRKIQYERYKNIDSVYTNSEINGEQLEPHLTAEARDFLYKCINKYFLSARGFYKLIKVSRTIADLDSSDLININHVSEAVTYKHLI